MERFIGFFTAPVPFFIIAAGLFFSFYLKFFYIRHPIKAFRAITEKEEKSGVSPFAALTLALSGTLGVGNIVGVAGAIALGGFGAVFWMWVSALCAMILKYAEIVLAVRHRREGRGERFGGAPYYIEDFFSRRSLFGVGKAVGATFAVLCLFEVLSTGCGIQMNAAAGALHNALGVPTALVGIFAAGLTFYAVGGGAERVSKVTSALIPILSLSYIFMSCAVMLIRSSELPRVFSSIFADAFSPESAAGGVFGFLFCRATRYGAMRGLLSNEAGCGTAPLAHAASNTDTPAKQGILGIFEVFFDTVVLCTMTAAVIIISYDEVAFLANEPIKMAIAAYSEVLGGWSEYFLAFAVAAFGVATVVCCAHYAKECIFYLFGGRGRVLGGACLAIYAAAAVVGATVSGSVLWHISDITLAGMTFINITVLLLCRKEIKSETRDFVCNYLKQKGNSR
ncbi:MAG: sodium:alanine symporter family protein [Ruminococcaceae bacterium]|nr:sodium:alanine symporter family protein [Oscillospiraceae bacterium]